MDFEVEKKFWLPDVHQSIERLTQLGVQVASGKDQFDKYYNHPAAIL